MKIPFFPPSDSGSADPPNVNDGAAPTIGVVSLGYFRRCFKQRRSCRVSWGFSVMVGSGAFRAGAGALAAPLVPT